MTQKEITSIEELVFDRSFRIWVLNSGSKPAGTDWDVFMATNPDKAPIINHAKAIVYALQINFKRLTEEEIDQEVERMLAKIKNGIPDRIDEPQVFGLRSVSRPFPAWLKVAAIFLVVAASAYLIHIQNKPEPLNSFKDFAASRDNKGVEQRNNLSVVKLVRLPDGSIVSLQPGSKITYGDFSGSKREVYLVGEAFFQITKDPVHPFYVYSNAIVTKVLGTSFNVKALEDNKVSYVEVKTGKVSVFKKENFTNADTKPGELGGTVLLPNQQVTYNSDAGVLLKSLVANPQPLVSNSQEEFVFKATPIKEVFEKLEMVYGVRIIADDEAISTCSLSATMGNESFYDKLDLICKSLNASYEVVDGDIVITAAGCN